MLGATVPRGSPALFPAEIRLRTMAGAPRHGLSPSESTQNISDE